MGQHKQMAFCIVKKQLPLKIYDSYVFCNRNQLTVTSDFYLQLKSHRESCTRSYLLISNSRKAPEFPWEQKFPSLEHQTGYRVL